MADGNPVFAEAFRAQIFNCYLNESDHLKFAGPADDIIRNISTLPDGFADHYAARVIRSGHAGVERLASWAHRDPTAVRALVKNWFASDLDTCGEYEDGLRALLTNDDVTIRARITSLDLLRAIANNSTLPNTSAALV